ncbi:MAG: 4-alpha-glucanotransferase [Candidatus Omnitrophica bacterium]|nr:4-alpha-glucanotransferase [Candidatus Omnitrophota bacterium]
MTSPSFSKNLSETVSGSRWEKIGFKKRSGVLIPLFSVYSQDSFGTGDLGDLKRVIDWAKSTSNSIIQLLPMNEVGGSFCPYDAVSSFALEPFYISLNEFKGASVKKQAGRIPAGAVHIDYRLRVEKIEQLWEIYLSSDLSEALDFEDFQRKNSYWLQDFALFKVLKEDYSGKPWYEWPDKFSRREKGVLREFWQENIERTTFQMWLQWVLFKQFKAAGNYAVENGILIKGDLPVLVSRDSADVWSHPEFFKLGFAAGAPPDMYCAKGQRWGMPTYDWDKIAGDGYCYLKEKLRYAGEFYDILRIDHVVGLFRIWSIPVERPLEEQGLGGVFDPLDEGLWNEHGRRMLNVLAQNTRMLLCAEDLGVIPRCCTDALLEFGIPGNDVQRWVKDWNGRHDFLPAGEYRNLAVTMLSTHDTTSWNAWWKYEAGTVDKGLFVRKCAGRGIDFIAVSARLFDPDFSFHGRLRWKREIDSVDKMLWELGKRKEDVGDFIELYENTFGEKEKLWNLLGCPGTMTEDAGPDLLERVTRFILSSPAVFCINSVVDYLSLGGVFPGDPYQYRINTPGTVSPENWSLRLPLSLEKLASHPVNRKIRAIITDSGRA